MELAGEPLPPTNYVHVDARERVWLTVSTRLAPRSLGYRADHGDGFIVLLDEGGARIVADGLGYANECLIHPEREQLYVNETFARRLVRFDVAADGGLSNKTVVARFGPGTFPDGLTFDAEGGIWITSIVSNRIIRVDPSGGQEVVLEDSDPDHLDWVEQAYRSGTMGRRHLDRAAGRRLKNISSLAFGGPDLRSVYLGCLLGDSIATFRSERRRIAAGPLAFSGRRGDCHMTGARLRLATAGSGYFSQFHYEAWRRLDVELAGICTRDPDSARSLARDFGTPAIYGDFAEMLDRVRPDLVDIITPPETHLGFIAAAAQRGIPMICQKPFTPSLEDAVAAVAIAEAAGVPLVVHENFRFQPWYGEIRRRLESGAIGEPYQVSFRLRPGDGQGPEAYLGRQPYFQKMERFLIHETAIHLIDVFRYLFGEVTSVTAELSRLNPAIAGEDAGLILFGFANGARGLFDGNRLADHAAENRRLTMGEMLVEGADGAIRLSGDGALFHRRHGANREQPIDYRWENRGFGGDSVYRLQSHVLDFNTAA